MGKQAAMVEQPAASTATVGWVRASGALTMIGARY